MTLNSPCALPRPGLTFGPSNYQPACDQAPSNQGRSQDLDDLVLYLASLQFDQANTSMSVSALQGQMLFSSAMVPLAENVDLGEGFSVRLVDTVLDSSVPAGIYKLYAVAVPFGEALLNQDAWMAFEQLEFEIRSSD